MRVWYNLGIRIYGFGIWLAHFFHPKAKLWLKGRKDQQFPEVKAVSPNNRWWFHCASLGEFEQARPLIENLRQQKPDDCIILSFFSPSGYEVRKHYDQVDLVCYLPLDLPKRINHFLDLIRPNQAIFVKYEFWFNTIQALHKRKIPLYLVSGLFRKDQLFFKRYGGYFLKQLKSFTHFFVQDKSSGELLAQHGIQNFTIAGDTRIDRVVKLIEESPKFPILEDFVNPSEVPVIVAGSTWPPDESLLASQMEAPYKWIIAPHDISKKHIHQIQQTIPVSTDLYSEIKAKGKSPKARVLILDTIGMLAYTYQYADICYIGGAFGKGLHNILEPLAHHKPVIIGPKYHKFKEATDLAGTDALYSVADAKSLAQAIQKACVQKTAAAQTAQSYLSKHKGATNIIIEHINP